MLLGYSLIIITTGIFALEIARSVRRSSRSEPCPACSKGGHDEDALHCKFCGAQLQEKSDPG
jgi:voltage-gated potassium channel